MPGAGVPLIKVVLRGKFTGTATWSTGCYFQVGGLPDPPTVADLLQAEPSILTAAQLLWNSAIGRQNSSATSLIELGVYGYSSTSPRVTAMASAEFPTALVGTGTPALPVFTSMVQSLRTDFDGRSYRGRMYMPASGTSLTTQGRFQDEQMTLACTATALFLTQCATALGTTSGRDGAVPVVASFSKGHTTPITEVSCDELPDTQHRREDKVGSTFTAVASVPPPS